MSLVNVESNIDSMRGNAAYVVHGHNIMDPHDRTVFRARSGLSVKDLAPNTGLATVCIVNGEYVLQSDWELIDTEPGDYVGFLTLPKGGGDGGSLQTVMGVLLIVAGVYFGNTNLVYAGSMLLLSGLLAPPSFVPLIQSQSDAPSPTYNIQLSGNSARLGQAIPVIYGKHIVTPDFAAAPYTEYNDVGDQFYHALLCIGVMDSFTIVSTMIDDTELSHFVEVETQLIGPQYPTPLSLINPAVVNAPEVANQELVYGTYVGPFAACGPGLQTVKIGIDVIFPKGLFFAEADGTLSSKTISWLVEARSISSTGAISGVWSLLGAETLTLADNSQIRRTYTYSVSAGRYEVRLSRTTTIDTNNRAGHVINWAGMRAYLNINVPLDDNANFLALRMKATNQLSGLSQRRIAIIIQRKLPTWNPSTGWGVPITTSSIAWALADVLKNPVYGAQISDSRIDLQTLYELDLVWTARGDTFNGVFDRRVTVWAALTTIARCGRARPIMRGNVFTFVRDAPQDLPVALFNMRNIASGSFAIDYGLVTEDSTDGIEMEFFDETTWSSNYVTMPIPGVTTPINPARISIMGISNSPQASRETAYMAADIAYRSARISFTTEMEGYLPAFGDLIAVAHDVTGWGISGDIIGWDGFEGECSEDLVWAAGSNYMIFTDSFGDVHGPFPVAQGSTPNSYVLLSGTFEPYIGPEAEHSRFAFGAGESYAKLCKVVAINPSSDNTVQIKAVVEDSRVHEADIPYGGSGSSGGSGGSGPRIARYAPSGTPTYDAASDLQRLTYGFYSNIDITVGSSHDEGYKYDH